MRRTRESVLAVSAALVLAIGVQGETSAPATVAEALAAVRSDIAIAAAELEHVRDTISAARIPLAAKLQRRQAEILALRATVGATQADGRHDAAARDALHIEVQRLREDAQFVETMLDEYRRGLETRLAAGDIDHLTALLARNSADLLPESAPPLDRLAERAAALLGAGMRLQRERVGGRRAPGTVLDGSGKEVAGAIVTVGPLTFFAAAQGPAAGPACTRPGHLAPLLVGDLPTLDQTAIATLVATGTATVPVDVTPGLDAARPRGGPKSLFDEIRAGGVVMVPLVAVGVIALIVSLWKLMELRNYCVRADRVIAMVLERLHLNDEAGARSEAAAVGSPLGDLLRDGIKHRGAAHEHLEEILHEHVVAAVPRLERHLGTLAVLAGIAPLLGLLGTVTGMIHTFQLVTLFGTGEARVLSGGISEALITTKFGLSIAIPVLLVHAFLARRVRTLAGELEASAMMFVARLTQRRQPDA